MAQAPDNWLKVCSDIVKSNSLTSMPKKFEFAKERGIDGGDGMTTLELVHTWMINANAAFKEMVHEAELADKAQK